MKRLAVFIAVFFLLSNLIAQQGNNWYFGNRAGITFNNTPPTALLNSAMNTSEGCSTISDSLGNLLFYTDGRFVYNALHTPMPNGTGLHGHPSSTHSSIVLKKPGSDSLYYIFTVDAAENSYENGYRYSVVDMSLDNGRGDVIQKNVLLYAPSTEKIAAVQHANGIDAWIVTKENMGDAFKAYKLTCDGVAPDPVTSHGGVPYGPGNTIRVGALKASPDGTMIASARYSGYWELFSFDRLTGQLSNCITIHTPLNVGVFGLEFSPNSSYAYISIESAGPSGSIFQYNVTVLDQLAITNSAFRVDSSRFLKGDMQLGPDGKIYTPNMSDSSLNVIHHPDLPGAACNYQYKAINLTFGKLARRCLPSFFKDNISSSNADFTYEVSPVNCNEITFTGTTTLAQPVNWQWDFGGGLTATGQTVTMVFNNITALTVRLTVSNPAQCGARAVKVKTLDYNLEKPKAAFNGDPACGSLQVNFADLSTISAGNIVSRNWDFGDNTTSTLANPQHSFPAFGDYEVQLIVTANGLCPKRDTLTRTITLKPKPTMAFTNDHQCMGAPVQFSATASTGNTSITEWTWSFGSGPVVNIQNPLHQFPAAGEYTVAVYGVHQNGCHSDTARRAILMSPKPVAAFLSDNGCMGELVTYTDQSTIPSGTITQWYWDYGNGGTANTTNGSVTYHSPGTFDITHVVVSDAGCVSDTAFAQVMMDEQPVALFSIQNECFDRAVSFTDQSSVSTGSIDSWSWNFGDGILSHEAEPTHTYSVDGSFQPSLFVTTTNGCKSETVTKDVSVQLLTLFAGNDTVAFAGQPLQLSANSTVDVSWSPSVGLSDAFILNPVATLQNDQRYVVKATGINGCILRDTVDIKVYDKPEIYVPTAFTPNGDGLNDQLGPICIGIKTLHYFSVYNRWGQIVYTTRQIGSRWDGTYNGKRQNTESFVWMAQGISFDGKMISRKGTTTLIR